MSETRRADANAGGEIQAIPVTSERWGDLETVFGPHGAYSGCWCMYWRTSRSQFSENGNPGNRAAFKSIVASGVVPGILYYRDGIPFGWCSIGPRDHYPSLNRSPLLKPVDDQPVWSIVCFYVLPEYRHLGLLPELVKKV